MQLVYRGRVTSHHPPSDPPPMEKRWLDAPRSRTPAPRPPLCPGLTCFANAHAAITLHHPPSSCPLALIFVISERLLCLCVCRSLSGPLSLPSAITSASVRVCVLVHVLSFSFIKCTLNSHLGSFSFVALFGHLFQQYPQIKSVCLGLLLPTSPVSNYESSKFSKLNIRDK